MKKFQARQSLKIKVPNESIPVENYLQEPQWLVAAITEADRLETLDDDLFRLKLRPKKFMKLQFEPQVDLRVWTDDNKTLHIRSHDYQLIGLEDLQDTFGLQLSGELAPVGHRGSKTQLQGEARIQVSLETPRALRLVPNTVLKTAGNAFLGGILGTMKGRVRRQIVQDYRRWVEAQESDQPAATAAQ